MSQKFRILLVEDELILRMYIKRVLKKMGYEDILETSKGEEAVLLAKGSNVSMIIMDIRLANGMDGITAAQQISEEISIPILFSSAYDCEEAIRKLSWPAIVEYLPKPLEKVHLEAFINRIRKI